MSKAKQIESATAQGSIPAPMGKPTSSSDNVISIHAEKPFRVDGDQCRDNPICGHGINGGSGNSRASTDGADDGLDICTADRMGSGAEDTVTDAAKSKKKRKKKKKSGNKRGQMAELEDDDQILITPNLSRETTPGTPGIEWVVPCESGYGSQSVKADVVSEESSHTLGKTPTPDQSPASTVRTMHEPSAIQRKVEAARAKHSSGNVIATPPVWRKKGKRVTSTSAVSTSGAASGRATPTEDCQMMKAIPLLRSTVDSDDENMKHETRFIYWYQGPQPSQDGADDEIDHNDVFEQVQQRAHECFSVDENFCPDESFDTVSIASDDFK